MSDSIIVVDDTPENLRLLANILTAQGYRVRLAPNGAHALAAIQKEPPSLVLLDIMMPDMNGYEVCRHLKAQASTREIPVVFISALNDVFDKVTAFNEGGVDYITKPFDEAEVLARVKTHLTLYTLQRDLAEKNTQLQTLNETLEEKVQARTAELAASNAQLQTEMEQRLQHQAEKDRLFSVVSQQSEQLRQLTAWLLQAQQNERQGLASGLQEEIAQNVALLQGNLQAVQHLLSPAHDQVIFTHLENIVLVLQRMQGYVTRVTTNLQEATAQQDNLRENVLIKLTAREREVLQLMAQGKTNAEIADLLTVVPSTIHTYIARVKQKLNIPNLPGIIKFAMENHLLDE